MVDNIKLTFKDPLIVNTDISSGPGIHWIVLYPVKEICYIIDPLGENNFRPYDKIMIDRINEFGNKAFMIDDVINFSFDFCPKNYVYINGYKVASLRDCYNVKKFLNRDKDKKLLLKLEKELNKRL